MKTPVYSAWGQQGSLAVGSDARFPSAIIIAPVSVAALMTVWGLKAEVA